MLGEFLTRLSAVIEYMLGRGARRTALVISVAIACLLLIDLAASPSVFKIFADLWHGKLDVYAGIATLGVALAVWSGELLEEWRDSLPSKLTVEFMFDFQLNGHKETKKIMECRYADLANISDARALSQQIGSQMTGVNQQLKFKAPTIKQTGGHLERDEFTAKYFKHYFLCVTLTELPDGIAKEHCDGTIDERVKNGKAYLLWEFPFDKIDTISH